MLRCPVCGRLYNKYLPGDRWPYRTDKQYVCSWRCLETYNKQKEEENEDDRDHDPLP